ncbi:hypothetical protein [Coleofasciculus sp.]|uniref:hypothetical protein n=1 Tax=Coleofasciculus sp. TaxID=3100458 RepID=UPI003A30ADC0
MLEISLPVILRVVFGLNSGDRYDRLKQLNDPNTSVQPWRRGITIVPSKACPMVVKTQRHVHSSREKVISY